MTSVRPPTARPTNTAHRPASPAASEAYRSQAGDYDQRTDAFRPWRELLVQHLPLRRGDTVLDVGCGTSWHVTPRCGTPSCRMGDITIEGLEHRACCRGGH